MKRIATSAGIILICVFFLGGCATIEKIRRDDLPKKQELATEAEMLLANEPSIVRLPIPKDAFQVREQKIVTNDRYVSISMHNVEIRDFMKALAAVTNLNIVYDMPDKNAPAAGRYHRGSSENQQRNLPQNQQQNTLLNQQTTQAPAPQQSTQHTAPVQNLPRAKMVSVSFKGKLSDLFKTLSDSTGYFFFHDNGAIVMKERETFSALVPNYPDLLKTIEGNIVRLGAAGVSYDDLSSSISFESDYAGYQRIKDYLSGMKENVSLVTMRIILMNVRLASGKSLGIDWSRMTAVGYQSQKLSNLGFNGLAQQQNNTSVSGSTAKNLFNEGAGAVFNSSGANLFLESARFSFSALLSFMENFGKYNIMQNVFVETMSGKKGKIEIVTESPYVSEVGVTSLSNNSATTSSTARTATAKAGVIMDFTPYYNKKQQMLTISLKVNVEGVNRYITLSAGSQLGSFMQPETTRKSVETFLRMKPDQVAIIGGLVYEMNEDEVNGLPTDTYLTKNVVGKKEKEELVIVVKPTIIEFVPEV